jgi:hypothetical protein
MAYRKLNDPPGPITGCSWFSIVVFTVFALVAFGYALTAYFAQPGQNMRIDLLAYQVTGLSNNLTNETNARIAKDMILMYNVSQLYMDVTGLMTNLTNETNARIDKDMILMGNVTSLQMSIDYIYNVLNITNGTGIEVMQTLMFLNSSVFNLTGDVNMIYNILNTTNTDLATLNQTVNNLINNVSALEAKTLLNGTGISITDQNAGSYGTISLTNISGVEGTHPFPSSVSVDGQGRITAIANGTEPMTSVTIGPGLSVDSMNPTVAGGTLNATSDYLQLQVIIPPGTHTHATVTVDTYGRVTMLSSGSHPVTSVAAGIGMSFATIDSMNPTGTINLSNISGVEGYWVNPAMNVDGQGRISSITNGTISGGVTSITAGAGLNGGVITTTGTISMPNVGTPGTYNYPTSITTDTQGRVSSVSSTFSPAKCSIFVNSTAIIVVGSGTVPLDGVLQESTSSCSAGYFDPMIPGRLTFVNAGKYLVQASFTAINGMGNQNVRFGAFYIPDILSPNVMRVISSTYTDVNGAISTFSFVVDAYAGLAVVFQGLDAGTTIFTLITPDYTQNYASITRLL